MSSSYNDTRKTSSRQSLTNGQLLSFPSRLFNFLWWLGGGVYVLPVDLSAGDFFTR
jgi:hypothetical protein